MGEKVTIDQGETLWAIAERELGDPQRWVDLFVKNHEALARKVYVQAGAELELPGEDERWDPDEVFTPSGN